MLDEKAKQQERAQERATKKIKDSENMTYEKNCNNWHIQLRKNKTREET